MVKKTEVGKKLGRLLFINVEDAINFIKEKIDKFRNSEKLNFKDYIKPNWRPKPRLLEFPGTYIIYENDKPIYMGMAGKGKHHLRYRISDLFCYSSKLRDPFHHTLTKKLFNNRFKKKDQQSQKFLSKKLLL